MSNTAEKNLINPDNSLTAEQRIELSNKLESIMHKYETLAERASNSSDGIDKMFLGIVDGLNIAYKIVNGVNDDYNLQLNDKIAHSLPDING